MKKMLGVPPFIIIFRKNTIMKKLRYHNFLFRRSNGFYENM